MKKSVKILVLVLVFALAIAVLAACAQTDEQGRTILSAPKNVIQSGDTLSWNENSDAAGYRVEVTNEDGSYKREYDVKFAVYSVSEAADGDYFARVMTLGDGENSVDSAYTEKFSFTKKNRLQTPEVSLNKATNVLSWGKVEGATGYQVVHKIRVTESTTQTYDLGADVLSLDLTTKEAFSLDSPADHYFSVRAVTDAEGVVSSVFSTPKNRLVQKKLTAPTSFKLAETSTGSSSVDVSWDKVDNATSYTITATPTDIATDDPDYKDRVYTYNHTSSTMKFTIDSSHLGIALAGDYALSIVADAPNDFLYTKSDTASGLTVTKLAALREDGLTLENTLSPDGHTAKLHWDDVSAIDGVEKVSFAFKKIGSTSSSYNPTALEKTFVELNLLGDGDVAKELSSTHGGKIFDIYIKLLGGGVAEDSDKVAVLDSEETIAKTNGENAGFYTYKAPNEVDGVYQITSFAELAYMHYFPGGIDGKFKLMNDLVTSDEIYPIAGFSAGMNFKGKFDGNGKSIYNFKMTQYKLTILGLFTELSSTAEVNDLAVLNATVSAPKDVTGGAAAGILAGVNNGKITACDVSGSISAVSYDNVGGVVGASNGGDITLSTAALTGAVAGRGAVGGFIGKAENTTISGCSVNFVTVSAYKAGDVYAGGFAGQVTNATITKSFAKGDGVSAASSKTSAGNTFAGGFVGSSGGGAISECYAEGQVSVGRGDANKSNFAGGFAGIAAGGAIENCYSIAALAGSGQNGGFAGQVTTATTVNKCFSSSKVPTGAPTGKVSALFVASDGGNITNCFVNGDASKDRNGEITNGSATGTVGATLKTAAQMLTLVADENMGEFQFDKNINTKVPVLKNLLYLNKFERNGKKLTSGSTTVPANFADYYGFAYKPGEAEKVVITTDYTTEKFGKDEKFGRGKDGYNSPTSSGLRFTVAYYSADGTVRIARYLYV